MFNKYRKKYEEWWVVRKFGEQQIIFLIIAAYSWWFLITTYLKFQKSCLQQFCANMKGDNEKLFSYYKVLKKLFNDFNLKLN